MTTFEQLILDQYPLPIAKAMIINEQFRHTELRYVVKDIVMHPKTYADMMTDPKMRNYGAYLPPERLVWGFNIIISTDLDEGEFRLLLGGIGL